MANHPVKWSEGAVPFSEQFSDHFYSEADGRAETEYVFLQGNGVADRWQAPKPFTVAELGFGTGLNFLTTWNQWIQARDPNGHLTFVSFEGYPLSVEEIGTAISRWPDLTASCQTLQTHWSRLTPGKNDWQMDAQTRLVLVCAEVTEGLRSWDGAADAWYLDGFAPARNPDMWSEELMAEVFNHTAPGGSFASYTSAGWVRRNLEQAGFEVKRSKGFGRKRHMIAGCKQLAAPPS